METPFCHNSILLDEDKSWVNEAPLKTFFLQNCSAFLGFLVLDSRLKKEDYRERSIGKSSSKEFSIVFVICSLFLLSFDEKNKERI